VFEGCNENPTLAGEYTDMVVCKIQTALNIEYTLRDIQISSSASIGAMLFLGDQHEPKQILKQADAAMYEAKRKSNR
jgi:GGDEF domain-containing protein